MTSAMDATLSGAFWASASEHWFCCFVRRGDKKVVIIASLQYVDDCCAPCIVIRRLYPDPGRATLFSQPGATLVSMLDEPVPIGNALYVAALSRLDASAQYAEGDWRLVMICLDTGRKAGMLVLSACDMFCSDIVHLPRSQDDPTMLVVGVCASDLSDKEDDKRWFSYFSVEPALCPKQNGDKLTIKRVATRPAFKDRNLCKDDLRSMRKMTSWQVLEKQADPENGRQA